MEPVLYLHGMGGAGKWEAFHMALGTVAHTFAPQLPGWTAGEPPDGIEGVQDYADLALGFLDAVELEKVALVGPLHRRLDGPLPSHTTPGAREQTGPSRQHGAGPARFPNRRPRRRLTKRPSARRVFAKLGMVAHARSLRLRRRLAERSSRTGVRAAVEGPRHGHQAAQG